MTYGCIMARFSALLLFSQLLAVARPLVIPEGALTEQAFLSPSTSTHHDHGHVHDNADDDIVYIQSPDVEATSRPSRLTSVLMARRLLALSTSGVASTIFPDSLPPNSRTPASVRVSRSVSVSISPTAMRKSPPTRPETQPSSLSTSPRPSATPLPGQTSASRSTGGTT